MKTKFKIFLFLIFSLELSSNSFSQACSAAPDTRPLPQLLYKNEDKLLVFRCKVISSEVSETGEAHSIAEIKEIYFGKTNLTKVRIWSGTIAPHLPPYYLQPKPQPKKQEVRKDYNMDYVVEEVVTTSFRGSRYWGIKMSIDSSYIIYTYNDTSYNQEYYGRSKQLTQMPAIKNEIGTLKTFAAIFKDKKTGHYIFKDYKNNLLASGDYKKGKPYGIWKNFDENGKLVSWEDFINKVYKRYYLSGSLSSVTIKYKDSTITENYFDNSFIQFYSRTAHVKNDTGFLNTSIMYDGEGFIKLKYSTLSVYKKNVSIPRYENLYEDYYPSMSDGKTVEVHYYGSFQEYYPKGRIKTITHFTFESNNTREGVFQQFYPNGMIQLNAQYHLNKKIGRWTWYNEDGTFSTELNYEDGKAPQ